MNMLRAQAGTHAPPDPGDSMRNTLNACALLLAAVVLGLASTGCIATSAKLKPEVTIGAERAGEWVDRTEGLTMSVLDAWRDTALADIDMTWGDIYQAAIRIWKDRHAGADPATMEEQRDVAGLAAAVRDAKRKIVTDRYAEVKGKLTAHFEIGRGLVGSVAANLRSIAEVRQEERQLLDWVAEAAKMDNALTKGLFDSLVGQTAPAPAAENGGTP